MLQWLTNRRRRKLMEAPFPPAWEEILQHNVPHYLLLTDTERIHLRKLIQVFLAEKGWEGCGGLILNDEIRVTISAEACLLILNIPHNYYENVESIIVYPSTVIPPEYKPGFFENVLEPIELSHPIVGQAFKQGEIIIVWDTALHDSRHPELGYNVVYHEFAHKLDMLDGAADGTPRLSNRREYHHWVKICSRAYLSLCREVDKGRNTFLDAYGAVNEAEFFAVATEHFFAEPKEMKSRMTDLYRVLKEYYRQDPARREGRNNRPA